MRFSILIITALLGGTSLAAVRRDCQPGGCNKPPRADFILINPPFDRIKPIATLDPSGWIVVDDAMIGPYTNRWLMSYSGSPSKPNWWFELSSPVSTPFLREGDTLYFGLQDGSIVNLNVKTGQPNWRVKLDRFSGQHLLVSGDLLYAYSVNQQLFALEKASGKTKWIYDAGEPENIVIGAGLKPVLQGDSIFVGTSEGEVHRVLKDNGKIMWEMQPDFTELRFHDVVGDLLFSDGKLVMARYDGTVAAFPLGNEDPKTLWDEKYPAITTSLGVDDVMFIGMLNGDVAAIDAKGGRKLWSTSLGQAIGYFHHHGNKIYAIGSNGRIAAFDRTSGDILWHDDIDASIGAAPFENDGILYFPTGLKALYGYKL